MRKTLITILLVAALLTGCNLPTKQQSTTTPKNPDEAAVATQVAVLLLTQTSPDVLPTNPLPTVGPTANLPTETLTPEPTLTTTPTPTITTTSIVEGEPYLTETFDSGKAYGLDGKEYKDDYTYIRMDNGALALTSLQAAGWTGWRAGGAKVANGYIEATIEVGACTNGDQYGMIFRSPDYSQGYFFGLTCSGKYDLRAFNGTDWTSVVSLTTSPDVPAGGQTIKMGIKLADSKIGLYVNGKLLQEVSDSSFTTAGTTGFFIAGITPGFTIRITEMKYW